MNFVAVKVSESNPLTQDIEEGIIFTVRNIALAGPVSGVCMFFSCVQ
jgi:hypothetical protein